MGTASVPGICYLLCLLFLCRQKKKDRKRNVVFGDTRVLHGKPCWAKFKRKPEKKNCYADTVPNTAAGLHGKSSLVDGCNAAKGSRQTSRVTWENAMALETGIAPAIKLKFFVRVSMNIFGGEHSLWPFLGHTMFSSLYGLSFFGVFALPRGTNKNKKLFYIVQTVFFDEGKKVSDAFLWE